MDLYQGNMTGFECRVDASVWSNIIHVDTHPLVVASSVKYNHGLEVPHTWATIYNGQLLTLTPEVEEWYLIMSHSIMLVQHSCVSEFPLFSPPKSIFSSLHI